MRRMILPTFQKRVEQVDPNGSVGMQVLLEKEFEEKQSLRILRVSHLCICQFASRQLASQLEFRIDV